VRRSSAVHVLALWRISFALASEASGQREHFVSSRAGPSLRSAARRGGAKLAAITLDA
jgi:hypothetical protein